MNTTSKLLAHPARLDRVGEVLMALHRDGPDVPMPTFRHWALGLLRGVLRFDSAMWGIGYTDPVRIHDLHLEDQPQEMIENYARFQVDDFFADACGASPGRTVDLYDTIDRADFVRRPIYRQHAVRYGMEHILCTVLPEPSSGLLSFVSLWRARYDDPYDADDRAIKQMLMPHLAETRRRNSIAQLARRLDGARSRSEASSAVCDRKAMLYECEPGFAECVRANWPDWTGPALPKPLSRALARQPSGALVTASHRFSWSELEAQRLVTARPRNATDEMSRREREVAALVSEGLTHREVAERLGVGPNTARSHMYRLYRRLGVTNKAQLIAKLRSEGPVA